MPGKNISTAAPLSPDEVELREELRATCKSWQEKSANETCGITRNSMPPPISSKILFHTRDCIRGATVTNVHGQACHNIEAEIPGARPGNLLIGAHYDSVFGSPGANDNGTGVAATLALARRFAGESQNTPCGLSHL